MTADHDFDSKQVMKTLLTIAALVSILSACKTTSQDALATSPPTTGPAVSSATASTGTRSEKPSPAPSTITSAENANPEESKVLVEGRELTSLFYKGETASIWARMTDEMKQGLRNEEALTAVKGQVADQLGAETKVVDEKILSSQGYRVYMRTASFSKWAKPMNITWTLDSQNRIAGFFIKPLEPPK
jgi:hypothetical protein